HETGGLRHGGLRFARLRALVRLLDGVRVSGDADLQPRLAAVRQLMTRAQEDRSPLRRAVWAALTRAGDALLRDGHAELTDLLLAWTTAFPDDDFAIVRGPRRPGEPGRTGARGRHRGLPRTPRTRPGARGGAPRGGVRRGPPPRRRCAASARRRSSAPSPRGPRDTSASCCGRGCTARRR